MSANEEPTTSASTQAEPAAPTTNGTAPPSDAAVTESTSTANEAAAAVDAPALPPADDDDKKDTGNEADLDMKAAETAEATDSGATVVAPTGDEVPASTKKSGSKRRASTGTPAKKLNKKKSTVQLQLDAKPGDYYWARLKGYPPWPGIICDEEMLPESLLANRPVTAMRPDGSYREDFMEGGKNVRDRTYPVMYLFTNEFSWMPNIDLRPLDFEDVKNAEQGKKSKQLWGAYQVAAEEHDLQHFKDVLHQHEEDLREEAAAAEAAAEEKAAKAEKKVSKKKSKATEDEDTVMEEEDVAADEEEEESVKKTKSSKKRKKDVESDGEGAKPAKTPKTKSLKLNTKTPNSETPTTTKSKKAKTSKTKQETPKLPELTEAEKKDKRKERVLYFRHKLQKGFLGTEPPKETEMKVMAEYFTNLEAMDDLEQSSIRETKIHKVLKAILKLTSIPQDEDYHFKDRSLALLAKWNKVLADGTEGTTEETVAEGAAAASGEEKPEDAKKEDVEMSDVKDEEAEGAKEVTETTAEEPKVEEPAEAPIETLADLGNDAKDEADNAPKMEEANPVTEANGETDGAAATAEPALE